MASAGCPDRETLAALAAGLLSGDALDAVAVHLDGCPPCLARVQAVALETDPLIAALCRPMPADPHVQEAGCDKAMARMRALAGANAPTETPTVLALGFGPDSVRPPAGGGRYRPVRLHARGGLGEVHVGFDEELSRRVALKRIQRPRAGDPESRRRFLQEAEITAQLEHPGVVPVYGLVQDDSGQPCYAMRFIQGETFEAALTRFHLVDTPRRDPGERRLALRDLLGRFVAACNTIAYAHSKGVLHRDLKPANIMLGAFGETLVVDWGLAKTVGSGGARPAAGTATGAGDDPHTRTGQMLGTPAYMSPEQAAGQAKEVGPAADVYGLGATLYAVLTGRPPLEGTTAEVLEQVRQGKIPPPRALKKDVPRPLEAVCLRAMALRPEDRYATALALAADVEHWLADEPVSAYREPLPGRLARWGRRHKPWMAGAAALMLATIIGLAGGLWAVNRERTRTAAERDQKEEARAAEAEQRLQARANEQKAQSEAALATAVKEFLQKDLLQLAAARQQSREQANGVRIDPDLKVRELVLRAAQKIEGKFKGQPLVEAEIRSTLGWTLQEIGRSDLALPQLLRVRELYTAHRGPDHPDTLHSMDSLASNFAALGRHPEALKLREETLALRKASLGPDHPDKLHSMNNLANSYFALGRHPEALELRVATLTLRKDKLGPDHPDTLHSMNNLANSYFLGNRTKEALELYEKALHVRKTTLGPDHPDTLHSMNNLANAYAVGARTQDALELRKETVRLLKAKLGPDHPDTLASMSNLASSYADAGRLQEALKLDDESFQLQKAKLGPDHHDTLLSMSNLALSYKALGRLDEALKLYEEALARWKAKFGPDHPDTIMSMYNLGVLRRRANNYAGAEELLLGCQAAVAAGQSGIHPHVRANVALELTRLYDAWGKPAEADKWLRQMPAGKRIEYGFERHYAWPLLWGWPRR